jgi:hypothetical protein
MDQISPLKFGWIARQGVLDLDMDLVSNALKNSQGEETMSPEDMKLCILGLQGVVVQQRALIDALYIHVQTPPAEKPKSFIRRLFRK